MSVNSGVHVSLHPNCHHQIIHSSFNLNISYNDKKIPLIPTLLVDDKHVTDIKTKANIFNEYFAEQCTLLKNKSLLPSNQTFLT